MTHEELVEKIKGELLHEFGDSNNAHEFGEDIAKDLIQMIGEDLADSVPLVASNEEYGAAPATENTVVTVVSVKNAIKSLTQGTKE